MREDISATKQSRPNERKKHIANGIQISTQKISECSKWFTQNSGLNSGDVDFKHYKWYYLDQLRTLSIVQILLSFKYVIKLLMSSYFIILNRSQFSRNIKYCQYNTYILKSHKPFQYNKRYLSVVRYFVKRPAIYLWFFFITCKRCCGSNLFWQL